MTIPSLAARADGHSTAIAAEGRLPLSYGALRRLIETTALSIGDCGVVPGDVAAIVLPNGPEAATAFLGVAAAATAAPLNPNYTESELEFYLRDLAARVVITAPEFESVIGVAARLGIRVLLLEARADHPAGWFRLRALRASTDQKVGPRQETGADTGPSRRSPSPGDRALVLHTSGTTARPKLVALTHANLCASARSVAASLDLSSADCCLNVMPLFHVHGLVAALLASLHAGGRVFCSTGFNAHRFFSWLADSGATWYTAVPSMHQAIVSRAGVNRQKLSAHRLRFVRSCSSPLPVQAWDALEKTFGVPMVSAYGMTEASHQISCTTPRAAGGKRGSVGRTTGPEIAIMDEAGTLVPAGTRGEVVLRGETVIGAYARPCAANDTSFTSGWFRTGDQGVLDNDGVLTLTGRLKEMINTGGEKVSPLEVDEVLMDHPAVSQAVAFAVPDPLLGERVGAAVVLRAGHEATAEGIRAFAARRLVKHKLPRPLLIVPAIPAGPTGKFQRPLMAEQLGVRESDRRP